MKQMWRREEEKKRLGGGNGRETVTTTTEKTRTCEAANMISLCGKRRRHILHVWVCASTWVTVWQSGHTRGVNEVWTAYYGDGPGHALPLHIHPLGRSSANLLQMLPVAFSSSPQLFILTVFRSETRLCKSDKGENAIYIFNKKHCCNLNFFCLRC